MILRDLILLVVWARVTNDLVQAVAHFVTYVMLRRTQSNDPFSVALRQRELALSGKNLSAAGFDLLIALSVTWSVVFTGRWFLPPILVLTALGAILASIFAIRFLFAYQRERWGMRSREETKVEQAATRTIQAAIEIRHTAEELRQGVVSVDQDDRQARQDERETELDVRADEADKRGKQQDIRSWDQSKESLRLDELRVHADVSGVSDVILKTAVDVEAVKQDVQAVKRKIVEEES